MSNKDDGEAAVLIEGHDNGVREAAATNEDEDEGRSDREHGESFFHCLDRVEPSGAVRANDIDPDIFLSDDGEDGLGDDVRVSFATAVGDRLHEEQAELDEDELEEEEDDVSRYDYDMWMAADDPVPIKERRRRLLQGMGLNSSRDLLRSRNARTMMRNNVPSDIPRGASRRPPHPPGSAPSVPAVKRQHGVLLKRCRSDNRLAAGGGASRKLPPLRRVYSVPHSLQGSTVHRALHPAARCPSPSAASKDGTGGGENRIGNGADIGHSLSVKNLDGGKEIVVSGGGQSTDGAVNDAHTGARLSVGDLEQYVGCPPLVKQLIRRSQSQPVPANKDGGKPPAKKKPRWLKNIKLVATAAGLLHEKDRDRPSALPSAVTMSKSKSAPASASAADRGVATPPPVPSSSSERLKVHHSGKSSKDLTGLYMRQEVRAHEGSIWSIKFSTDGRFLATGGEDRVVRVWQVIDADASTSSPELSAAMLLPPLAPTDGGSLAAAPGLAAQLSRKVRRGKSGKHVLPEHVVVPETLFALAEKPACVFEGHVDDVLDLSWSRQSPRLLSSSMDKTVRLWDVEGKSCLKVFAHSDYVTCIQFNPADDGYFISGSLDCKVRIWSVADRQVVDWSDLTDMVTAACYTPDGQAAIVGSHKGCCRFYKTRGIINYTQFVIIKYTRSTDDHSYVFVSDCKLNQEAQIDMSISKKRKSQAKKITGFQFAPGNPSEILVTSADSQIRVFNGITVLQKFKGFKNTSSQLSATYSGDGRYVVCASEDSHVYVWRRAGGGIDGGARGGGIGVKAKTWLTSRSYEYFFCRDVSAAVPWPGLPSTSATTASGRAPDERLSSSVHGGSRRSDDDAVGGGVPLPLPLRPKSGPMTYTGGQAETLRRGASSRDCGGNAWGMVVVTASLGGEIRVYQNFGMPLGIRGQSNRFH
ncbi:hypothetical protein ACQ4PT_060600 [Festuca glaucescens]